MLAVAARVSYPSACHASFSTGPSFFEMDIDELQQKYVPVTGEVLKHHELPDVMLRAAALRAGMRAMPRLC